MFIRIFKLLMVFCCLSSGQAFGNVWVGNYAKQSERQSAYPCTMLHSIPAGGTLTLDHWDETRATGTYFCFEVYMRDHTSGDSRHPAGVLVNLYLKDVAGAIGTAKIAARYASYSGNNAVFFVTKADLLETGISVGEISIEVESALGRGWNTFEPAGVNFRRVR